MEFKLCVFVPQISTVEWCNAISSTASRASLSGSTGEQGRTYSSLEWSKCPRTFTRLYSSCLIGLSHTDYNTISSKLVILQTLEIMSHGFGRRLTLQAVGQILKFTDQLQLPLSAFQLQNQTEGFSQTANSCFSYGFYQINTKLMHVSAIFRDKRLWQVSTREATSGRSLLLLGSRNSGT